jgi:uncharacterized membrane protein
VILNVLWALGWSMVILAVLARLPLRMVAAISVGTVLLHNLLDPVPPAAFGSAAWAWNVLHVTGAVPAGTTLVITAYPLIPWFAVMAAGYCFGSILRDDAERRRRWFVRLGIGLTLGFVIVRAINLYGDPQPWSPQANAGTTVLSFLRTTKYPPSLAFLLMTIGPSMLIWAWLDRMRLSRYNPLVVFGRVPLFYFIGHLFVIHGLTYVFALSRYGTAAFLSNPLPSLGGSAAMYPPGFGYDLPVVYLVWILVVALMYLPCVLFARLKEKRTYWWLQYV